MWFGRQAPYVEGPAVYIFPVHGSSRFLQNIGTYLSNYMALSILTQISQRISSPVVKRKSRSIKLNLISSDITHAQQKQNKLLLCL
jgi:hypothetical protein